MIVAVRGSAELAMSSQVSCPLILKDTLEKKRKTESGLYSLKHIYLLLFHHVIIRISFQLNVFFNKRVTLFFQVLC